MTVPTATDTIIVNQKTKKHKNPQKIWTNRVNAIKDYFGQWVKLLPQQRQNRQPNNPSDPIYHFLDVIKPNFSFQKSYDSSRDSKTHTMNGDSIFFKKQQIFITKISKSGYIGMKRSTKSKRFEPITIKHSDKLTFRKVRVHLENFSH